MFAVTLSVTLFSLLHANAVLGQGPFPDVPLANKRFKYPDGIPEKVDTDTHLARGAQFGYNRCDASTEGPNSNCQTAFLNSLDDFCLWGPPQPGLDVGSHEGEMVAWCTKPGRGTRLIPAGALTGVQFMKTPDYVQVVGFIDQTKINVLAGDFGGEMDPHGADLRGNPLGGLFFSTAWGGKYTQAVEWHNFLGGNTFCLKLCDPAGPNAAHFCEHRFDRIGCSYNAPNNAQNNVFESCQGENQDFPGIYTENGQVMTYTQPAESLGVISTMPYQPRVPASSSCQPFQSTALFNGLPAAPPTPVPSSSTSSSAPISSATSTSSAPSSIVTSSTTAVSSPSRLTNSPSPTTTINLTTTASDTATAALSSPSNSASTISVFSGLVSVMGVMFSILFFA